MLKEYINKTSIILDKHKDRIFLEDIELWFIEIGKFRKKHKKINSKIDGWIAFIDDEDKELVKMAEKRNKVLQKARKEVDYLTGDERIQRMEELREMWELDYNSDMYEARTSGTRKGRREGRREEKKDIAKKLLELQMSVEQISEITDLSEEEIKAL